MYYSYYESPVGSLLLHGEDQLEGLVFPKSKIAIQMGDPTGDPMAAQWVRSPSRFDPVKKQLDDYFQGNLKIFDLGLSLQGTDFQKKVWHALTQIPYGKTISYGDLAQRIGNPKACRAVGLANGKNPIPIIIPCHRVIGKNGKLTGFGGGIPVKQHLLELESTHV